MCSLLKTESDSLNPMAISNELSSEIAAAMLAGKKSPQELKELGEIVLRVHNALQTMSHRAVTERMKARATTQIDHIADHNVP
jgi:hypothetical protein